MSSAHVMLANKSMKPSKLQHQSESVKRHCTTQRYTCWNGMFPLVDDGGALQCSRLYFELCFFIYITYVGGDPCSVYHLGVLCPKKDKDIPSKSVQKAFRLLYCLLIQEIRDYYANCHKLFTQLVKICMFPHPHRTGNRLSFG